MASSSAKRSAHGYQAGAVSSPGVIIVGAAVSGLACAGALREAGLAPVILERARGVGGRCATHRLEGQRVDLGPAFLHGADKGFLAAPMLFSLEGGARLGICGDRFARGSGVEAAWSSGRALAQKILSLEKT